jgi:hypothetical protein
MSLQKYAASPSSIRRNKNRWFERVMAIAALANLALVVFDLTYVPWRNFWLQGNIPIPFTGQRLHVPLPTMDCRDRSAPKSQQERTATPPPRIEQSVITCLYDPVKGIQPHRETQFYLNTVQQLETQLAQKGLEQGLSDAEVQATLADLRRLSAEMVDSNPFEAAGKSGTLEKIKNEMRRHVSERAERERSAKAAFEIFWSTSHPVVPNYLTPQTWNSEIDWFNNTIKPLVATNYYRSISENGEPTNNFWLLDAPFVTLFLLEFLARTFYISRRYASLSWLDAMIWRWMDIPLLLPFSLFSPVLALSRVFPTMLRLHQADLIDLHDLNSRVRQGFVAAIGEEITEVVVVQVVNQLQSSMRQGDIATWLQRATSRRYVDLNDVNEIEAIAQKITQIAVYQVFPKIQPELEAVLRQSIQSFLSQSPAYRGLQGIPGIGSIPNQLTERLVADLTQAAHHSLKTALEDPELATATAKLVQSISNALISETQTNDLEHLQELLSDLLEEIKINYIQKLSEEDTTLILNQTRQARLKSDR